MEINDAIAALSALAQETRLKIFRLLVECGSDGMSAGEIAGYLECPQNTLSTHLGILDRCGLLQSQRKGRSIIYSVNMQGTQKLFAYLLQDCCKGRAELCGPLPVMIKTKKKVKG